MPVYRLDLLTMAIEKVTTRGDGPGWISEHEAWYERGPTQERLEEAAPATLQALVARKLEA